MKKKYLLFILSLFLIFGCQKRETIDIDQTERTTPYLEDWQHFFFYHDKTLHEVNTGEDIKTFDRRRVEIKGIYRKYTLRKGGDPVEDDVHSPYVEIVLEDKSSMCLYPFWQSDAHRSADEIEQFNGREVRLIGKVHQMMPDTVYSDPDDPFDPDNPDLSKLRVREHFEGHCVTEIELIELIPVLKQKQNRGKSEEN